MGNLPKTKYFSIHEAAKHLGVSTKTLRRWEASGKLLPVRTKGGHRRYVLADLSSLLNKKGEKIGKPRKVYVRHIANVEPQAKAETNFFTDDNAPYNIVTPIPQEKLTLYKSIDLHPEQKKVLKTVTYLFLSFIFLFLVYKITSFKGNSPQSSQSPPGRAQNVQVFSTGSMNVPVFLGDLLKGITAYLHIPPLVRSIAYSYSMNFPQVSGLAAGRAQNVQVLAAFAPDVPVFEVNIRSKFKEVADFINGLTSSDVATGTLEATGAATFGSTINVAGDATFKGNVDITGDLTSPSTTFNLLNTNVTTLNIGGASTATSISATTGTTTINNNLLVKGKITGSGDLSIAGASSLNSITGTTLTLSDLFTGVGITSSGPITFTGLDNVNGILFSDTTGLLHSVGNAIAGLCLIATGPNAYVWGACSAPWQKVNATDISTVIAGDNLVIGGTQTSNAKFEAFGATGNVTTIGNIQTTGGGTITSSGLLTGTSGITITGGTGFNVTTGGAITGVISLDTIATTPTALTFVGAGSIAAGGTSNLALDAGTTGDVNIAGISTGNINIGGGSTSTGCTVVNSTGDLICTGNITGSSSGSSGFWTRVGTTLSPTTAGDNVTTSGNLSTTGTGTITSAGLLTGNAGLTISGGTANINVAGTSNTAIGNATGTFSLISNGGLNVTTGGALTGVASIDTINFSSTAITFAGAGSIAAGGTSNLTLDAGTSGDVNIGGISTGNINIGGGSGSTGCTITNATGDLTCTGNINGAATGTIGYWSRTGTTLSPATSTDLVNLTPNVTSGTGTTAGLYLAANSLTSGNAVDISSTSTAGDTSKLLNLSRSGVNGTASKTNYGLFSNITNTGTTSTNVAGYFSASGATNNYGLVVPNGYVGIGTSTPASQLDINANATSGTVFNLAYGSPTTIIGSMVGAKINLDDGNVIADNQNVTGLNVKLPTVTNNGGGSYTLQGLFADFGTGAGINNTGSGTTTYNAASFILPALTQTSGTLTANGLSITTPSGITTGGTANGININPAGVGAGNLNGLNIGGITGGAGTEYALSIGSGWDSILRVNGTQIINGSGVTQVAGGGTSFSTYAQGDILYASAVNTLSKLAVGSTGYVLTVSAGGVPTWNVISGSSCSNCLISNPSSDQVISPIADAVGLQVRQSNAVGPVADIFSITNNSGLSKYFYVDAAGVVHIPSIGAVSSDQLTIQPGTDKFALKLLGTNVATNSLEIINSFNTQGNIFTLNYPSPTTLAGTVYGFNSDLSTNVTATNQSVFGSNFLLPAVTNTNTSGTKFLTGLAVAAGGGLNQNGAGGTTQFAGADITIPALTQSAGTINGYGVNVTTPSSITTGGTAVALNVNATGIGAGSLYGVNISGITGGAGVETALNIGAGWDNGINSASLITGSGGATITGTTSINTVGITSTAMTFAGAGTINATTTGLNLQADGSINVNIAGGSGATGCTVDNTTGNLTCTGNIVGSASGTSGFWTRTGTVLTPTTSGDAVTINGLLTAQLGLTASGAAVNLNASSNFATNINTGNSTGAISIGNSLAGAIAISTGSTYGVTTTTGAQTYTSANVSGNTTSGAFVFTDAALTTGTGIYGVSSSVTTGKLLDLATSGNTWTGNGTTSGLINLASTSTAGSVSGSDILLNIARSGTNTNASHTAYGLYSSVTNTGTTSTNYGAFLNSTGATTDFGLGIGALTGATSTGVDIGNLSGATANKGINIGTITAAATATNFGINIGAITPQASATVASLNTAGITAGAGTATYGINLGTNASTATNNYGIKIGAISGAGTTNYGLYVDTVNGAGANYAGIFAGGNVGIGTTTPTSLLSVGSSSQFQINSSGNIVAIGAVTHSISDSSGLTLSSANNTLNLQPDGAINVNIAGGSSATGCTINNTTGDLTCTGNITGSSSGTSGFWARNSGTGTLTPATATDLVNLTPNVSTGIGLGLTGNSLSTGMLLNIASTSTSVTTGAAIANGGTNTGSLLNLSFTGNSAFTGNLATFDWSPTSSTTATGNLFTINTGTNAVLNGDIFQVQNAGSDLFAVNQTQITNSLPTSFTAPGDVSIAYDIQFTNQTQSSIKSKAPLVIDTGESFESNDLTLRTYNAGQVVVDSAGGIIGPSSTALIVSAASTGLNLQADGAIDVNLAGGSGATGCTVANATGNLTCTGSVTGAATGTMGFWTRTGTTLSPATSTDLVSLTPNVSTGTTTSSGFSFSASSLTSGTGAYFTSSSVTTGKLAQIANTGNTLTTGTLLDISSPSTSITTGAAIANGGTNAGSLLNLSLTGNSAFTGNLATFDWSPTVSTTATGNLFTINTGTNAILNGNIFQIQNAGSNLFAVNQAQITNALPTQFTAPGDISDAYDLNFTNPTVSYIRSSAPLIVQAGEVFNSSNLTLRTFNQGTVVVDSAQTTGNILDITNTTLTTGIGLNITGSALTTGKLVNIGPVFTGSAATAYGEYINGADSTANANTDYNLYSTLALTGNAAKTGIGIFGTVSTSSTTADLTIGGDFATLQTGVLTAGTTSVIGVRAKPQSNSASTAGNLNIYGILANPTESAGAGAAVNIYSGYFAATASVASGVLNRYGAYVQNAAMDTNGTSTQYGLFVESLTGADNNYAAAFTSGNVGIGTITPTGKLALAGNVSAAAWGTAGIDLQTAAATYTDTSTGNGGTATNGMINTFGIPTIASTGTTVVTTNAANIYVAGAPVGGTNETLTNSVALRIATNALTNVGTGYGLFVDAPTGATTANYAASFATGSVGVGTATPTNKLDVSDSQATASAIIRNTSASAGITGLAIKLSSTTLDTTSRFINFLDLNGTIIGKIQAANTTSVSYAANGTDMAEYFTKDPNATFTPGDVVKIGDNGAILTNSTYDPKMIGVVSTAPSFVGGVEGADKVIVAIVGQVPVKIAVSSDPIKKGDMLTSSTEAGKAMKATTSGSIIGKALQDWNPGDSDTINVYLSNSYYGYGDFATSTGSGTLADSVFTATDSGIIAKVQELDTTKLNVLGDTVLADTVINGKLNVGTLTLDNVNQSVNAIGVLKIQDLALGNVEFMNGLIVFDTNGNATFKSVTADKYNVAGTSAGVGTILTGQTSVQVNTNAVTSNSLIFVTAQTATTKTLAVTAKTNGTSFKVEIPSTDTKDIQFNWWIVDKP